MAAALVDTVSGGVNPGHITESLRERIAKVLVDAARTINRSKWRDEWVLHGWNGGAEKGAPHRVADMVDVERLAEASVDAGMSQRLLAVLSALEYRKPPIDEVFSLMT